MRTAIVTSDTFENHLTGDGLPLNNRKRVISIINILKKRKIYYGKTWCSSRENIKRYYHTEDYIKKLKTLFLKRVLTLDGDTVVSPGSKEAVFDAAGSTIKAIDGIERKKFKNAFCVVRPPIYAEKNKAKWVLLFIKCWDCNKLFNR